MIQFIRTRTDNLWEKWLSKNIHRTRSKVLDRNKVFIFPTRQGLFFGSTVLCLFLAGINYANSLILTMCFMLVSLFIVTILHTFRNLSGLEVSIGRIENAFAGDSALFSVRIERLFDRPYEALSLVWHDVIQEVDLLDKSQLQVDMLIPCKQRGVFKPKRLKLETAFPLGIIRSWAYVDFDCNCLVYPKPIENSFDPNCVGRAEHDGEKIIPRGVEDFDMLRAYQNGDSLKHVDWKAFAKTDVLYTKSFVDYADDHSWLDWAAMGGVDGELCLSYLCYWVLKLSEREAVFGLRLPGVTIAPAMGHQHKIDCLEKLALAQL